MSEPKQKFAIWLSKDQAERFDAVFRRANERAGGRAEFSEIMKELIGFPLPPGVKPLITDAEKQIISSGPDDPTKKHRSR